MRKSKALILLLALIGMPAEISGEDTSPNSGYVRVNGIRIHYLEWGRNGPPVILLHGMRDDARIWKDLAPILASSCHVFAPDRRGSGESDRPEEGYDFPTLVSDIAQLAENLKLKRVTLIGHSFGAETALTMAALKPELIRSVVLVDGGFRPKSKDNPATTSSAIEKTSRDYDPEALYTTVDSPVLLVFARGAGPGPDVLAELKKKGIDYFEELRKGEQLAKELADRKLRHKQITFIENTGHWIQVDQPQSLARVILSFLESAPR